MRVRCGACRSEVEIPGPGRFNCPACGAPNEVRDPAAVSPGGIPPPGGSPFGAPPPQPPPLQPDPPSPKISCGECEFSFIVGDIDRAVCPNCGAEVVVDSEGAGA